MRLLLVEDDTMIGEAVRAGLNLPASAIPDVERGPPPQVSGAIADMLRVLLKIRCEERRPMPAIVCRRKEMENKP